MGTVSESRNRPNRRRRQRGRGGNGPVLGAPAIDIARGAIDDMGEGDAGEHSGVNLIEPGVAVHRFQADRPGYRGWEWHVVVACAKDSDHVTVSEVALVPGDRALKAPEWVPYEDRLLPGDLGPRDLLPPSADDPRLTPGPPEERKLSDIGVAEAAARWSSPDAETGPASDFAREAIRFCGTCAFMVPLTGALGEEYGACTNEWAFDGSVVHHGHGCGAHSATPEVIGEGISDQEVWEDVQSMGPSATR